MSYSREIKMPKTRREGLANFVQIIINKIEGGDVANALLAAVDLHEDLACGVYDDAMTDKNAQLAIIKEMEAKHTADIIAAAEKGREDGIREEKVRVSAALGLLAVAD